jgi:hypothetical protein
MSKLTVGQTVFVKTADYQRRVVVRETTVTRVGRKFFEIADYEFSRSRFSVETMRVCRDIGVNSERCYLTRQEIDDEREYQELQDSLRRMFDHWGSSSTLTLDQLRRVDAIVKEGV